MADIQPQPPIRQASIDVFALIRHTQLQHGLRHQDYERYRAYCARRIHRIRRAAKVTHGKRYKKRTPMTIEQLGVHKHVEEIITLPLFNAERAWSHAQAIRDDISKDNTRKRHHMMARLRKAASAATEFALLCKATATPHTTLQAIAYAEQMQMQFFVEKGAFGTALKHSKNAKNIYTKLQRLPTSSTAQAFIAERVQQLDDVIIAFEHRNEEPVDKIASISGSIEINDADITQLAERAQTDVDASMAEASLKTVTLTDTHAVTSRVSQAQRSKKRVHDHAPFLLDRLNSYISGHASNHFDLIDMRPHLLPTPSKPVLFDLVYTYILN